MRQVKNAYKIIFVLIKGITSLKRCPRVQVIVEKRSVFFSEGLLKSLIILHISVKSVFKRRNSKLFQHKHLSLST